MGRWVVGEDARKEVDSDRKGALRSLVSAYRFWTARKRLALGVPNRSS